MRFQRWLFLLKICVSVTLFARGWLTWKWDSPVRSLIWQEDWWSSLIEKTTGVSWRTFATTSDPWISGGLGAMGIILMSGAILPWIADRSCCRGIRWLLVPMTLLLLLDGFASWVAVDYRFGMAIEHTLQIVTPLALFLALGPNLSLPRWQLIVSIAAALTFIGHGCFAAGIHPVPLSYQNMTMNILGVSQDTAIRLLSVAGWLDLIVAICLFFPRTGIISLFYLITWGGATACARVVAHFDLNATGYALDPWAFETAVRTSHWLLPLLLLFLVRFKISPESPSEKAA
ncbi:MAG: hypothetical protein P1U68_10275 [Verrucomicrobiales bacterium]|nr:hypothetical protein [Verrucomicrobiales bacterium]